MSWTKLASLPDPEGFAGAFAGVSRGTLLVAGGANFPEKRPWEGGTKVWTDTVFALDRLQGAWKVVGKLPCPLGYGVSASYRDGVICVGGSDLSQHYSEAFRLEWRAGRLRTLPLPALPIPLANGCGTLVGETLYVAAGQESPTSKTASRRFFSLNLSRASSTWRELPPVPGPGRILATAAAFSGSFWLFGGAELYTDESGAVKRRYRQDAYQYTPERGWRQLADLPSPVVAAPSPAPTSKTEIFILGGDDGSRVGLLPQEHPGFSKSVLHYDPKTNQWARDGETGVARVTVPVVRWGKRWIIAGGEARPGVRSPEVWSFEL